MARRLEKSMVDYVTIWMSPVLIMLLVGSLTYFLLESMYEGQYAASLKWVMFFFVVAIVLVSRIGIEQGVAYAAGYGLALAAATSLVVMKFSGGSLSAIAVLGVIWWCANKLTWDCTLIEDTDDASGEGLLQVAGVSKSVDAEATTTTEIPEEPRNPDANPSAVVPENDSTVPWWQRFLQDRTNPGQKAHAPGLWVVYFSMAALPIFGLGQLMISSDAVESHDRSFNYLRVYMVAGLALLMTTSFLGLRRYLRQRKLNMPVSIATKWLGMGALVIVGVLLIAMLLPRPQADYSLTAMLDKIGSDDLDASDWAMLPFGAGKGEGNPIGDPDEDGKEAESGGGSEGKGGENTGGEGNPKGGSGSKSGESQSSGSNSGSSGNGEKQSGESKKSPSDPGQKGDPSGQKTPGSDPAGQQDPSHSNSPSPQKKTGEYLTEPDPNRPDPSRPDPNQTNSPNDPGDPGGSNDPNQNGESDPSRESKTASGGDAGDRKGRSKPKSGTSTVSKIAGGIASLVKWLIYLAIAVVVVLLVVKNWSAIQQGLSDFLNRLRELWASLFGGKSARDAAQLSAAAIEQAVGPSRPRFATFQNPFGSGQASKMSPEELIAYSFEALEAWASEHGLERPMDQTPLEFAREIGEREVEIARQAHLTALLYTREAYSDHRPPREYQKTLEGLWRLMSAQTVSP